MSVVFTLFHQWSVIFSFFCCSVALHHVCSWYIIELCLPFRIHSPIWFLLKWVFWARIMQTPFRLLSSLSMFLWWSNFNAGANITVPCLSFLSTVLWYPGGNPMCLFATTMSKSVVFFVGCSSENDEQWFRSPVVFLATLDKAMSVMNHPWTTSITGQLQGHPPRLVNLGLPAVEHKFANHSWAGC